MTIETQTPLSAYIKDGYHVLTLEVNRLQADYLVSGESWRIEKVIGTLHIGSQQMQFFTEHSDFKVVDGVLMHHVENKFAGQVTANQHVAAVTHEKIG